MAGQTRVKEYLDEHQIGALFEELMAKVIGDMPDEPVMYLIRALQRKAVRMGISTEPLPVRKSMDPEGMAVPKERNYDKPWQSHSSKRPTGTHPARKSGTKPDWNADSKVKSSTDLDDLWESKGEGQVKLRARSPSPVRRSKPTALSQEEGGFAVGNLGYTGPKRPEERNPLEAELLITYPSAEIQEKTTCRPITSKRNDMRSQTQRHRQELERLIIEGRRTAVAEDSGISDEDERRTETDDAVELMEDPEALRNEGVTHLRANTGALRSMARVREVVSEPAVRVSICARCAKVMTGEPSAPLTSVGDNGEMSSRTQSAALSPGGATTPLAAEEESDEEFESVSQVTGPRRPIWPDNNDVKADSVQQVFATSTSNKQSRRTAQSQNFEQSSSSRTYTKSSQAVRQTWAPGLGSSDEPAPVTEDQTSGSKATSVVKEFEPSTDRQDSSRQGWAVHDNETEASSYYGSPGHKGSRQGSY